MTSNDVIAVSRGVSARQARGSSEIEQRSALVLLLLGLRLAGGFLWLVFVRGDVEQGAAGGGCGLGRRLGFVRGDVEQRAAGARSWVRGGLRLGLSLGR